jgi:hypothetical protein
MFFRVLTQIKILNLQIYTGEDLKPHAAGVLCTAKRQIVTDISRRRSSPTCDTSQPGQMHPQ